MHNNIIDTTCTINSYSFPLTIITFLYNLYVIYILIIILVCTDPYVKIYMLHKNKRMFKGKTSVKRHTLTPVFNESFEFDTTAMDIDDITLEIFVMDYSRFGHNDIMGEVSIGGHVLEESGRVHWSEMLESPRQQVSHWHSLLPPEKTPQGKLRRLTM